MSSYDPDPPDPLLAGLPDPDPWFLIADQEEIFTDPQQCRTKRKFKVILLFNFNL
jgi:hypothetical protein